MMRILSLLLSFLTASALFADSVTCDGKKLIIHTSKSQTQNVYYVDFPPSIVHPPNNRAYSGASITTDGYIWLSGLTGLDLQGNPIPPVCDPMTGKCDYMGQISQAYHNLANVLAYLHIPLSNVLKLDVLVEAGHGDFEIRRAQANQVENQLWGESAPKPPRTISGVQALNKSVFEVLVVVKLPYSFEIEIATS